MKKNISKKIIYIFVITAVMILAFTIKSNAATLSISTSKSSVSPGETFTVTVKLSNGAGAITSGGQTQWLDNSSFSYTKTAGSSGSITVTASGTAADYSTEKDESVYASKTVTIVQPQQNSGGTTSGGNSSSGSTTSSGKNTGGTTKPTTTTTPNKEEKKSNDATLKELSIAEGTLIPEFNAEIKEYKTTVPNEITALTITANPNDSKATVSIEGNQDFVIGENKVTVKITAEDGTINEYYINIKRQRNNLALQTLKITYIDQEGNEKEIKLNPNFSSEILEYSFDEISYLINSLNVEATANLEEAVVEILGNENLKSGENKITIKLTIKAEVVEGEEQLEDEVVIYTITFLKEATPTLIGKISNWYSDNQGKVIFASLLVAIVLLGVLFVIMAFDYKKYKKLLEKITELNAFNNVKEADVSVQTDINNVSKTIDEKKKSKVKSVGKH